MEVLKFGACQGQVQRKENNEDRTLAYILV